jgi:hypothetical protein
MSIFQLAKIYKLECLETGKVYIGSTTQELNQRKSNHKSDYKKWLNGKTTYTSSFEIIKSDKYEITLIERYPCTSNKELTAREKHWIQNTECINIYLK